MKIAIQAADLDNNRIDGTRVYLWNVLKHFGKISPEDDFFIYHKNKFNSSLKPKEFSNYKIKRLSTPPVYWTQTRFALELLKSNSDKLWMPMQALPFVRRPSLQTTVTIHDLAFKYFPEHFPRKDLRRLNLFTNHAIKNSDKIIAVSQSTRNDILKFYPGVNEDKIKVVYHGFDPELFQKEIVEEEAKKILDHYGLCDSRYALYVGAIQPRKNLRTLVEAFDLYKKESGSDIKLVLAGSKAWMWEDTIEAIEKSNFSKDIVLTGRVSFADLSILYRSASLFAFPSIYEGFGIPILEAFASGVPVICASNSSLTEVGGNATEYFDAPNANELKIKLKEVLESKDKRGEMIAKGNAQLRKFSWEKCAKETLEWIKK